MVNNDIRHDKDSIELVVEKFIVDVCLTLKVIPKGLVIKKTLCIRVTDNKLMEKKNVTFQILGRFQYLN